MATRSRSLLLALAACSILGVAGTARAVTLDVAADGGGTYATIADAVVAAAAGDTIVLGEGVFTGAGNRDVVLDRDLTLMSADPAAPSVIDCQGSAVSPHRAFTIGYASCRFEDLVIERGYNLYGAAVYTDAGVQVFERCVFDTNIASSRGGAVYAEGALGLSLYDCVFTGNRALSQGGALYVASDIEVLCARSTLHGNTAVEGGGIYSTDNAVVRLNSSVIAFGQGGGAVADYFGGGWIVGCTDIYGNVGGDWTGVIAGQMGLNNNVGTDPVFCDAAGGNLTLHETSPLAPDNNPCGLVGALPVGCLSTVTVELDGSGDFTSIREALLVAHDGDRILVGPGTYEDTGSVIDKPGIRLISPGEDSWITGQGLAGPAALKIRADGVVVSGLGIDRCVGAAPDSTAGIVIDGCDPVLNNVTLSNCFTGSGMHGGALRIVNGSPTVNGGRIADCGGGYGGGVYIGPGSSPAFYDVEFSYNDGGLFGAAFYATQAGPTFDDCVFRSNAAGVGGAGYAAGGDLAFNRCLFLDNDGQEAGALYLSSSAVVQVLDCTFAGNTAFNVGGAIVADVGVETAVTGSTFVRNGANDAAGHIYNANSSDMTIQNCILAFSSGPAAAVETLFLWLRYCFF